MVKTTFSHIGLNCKDPVKIEKFYKKYFDFERARVFNPGPDQVVMIKKNDVYMELFPAEKKRPIDEPQDDGYTFPGVRHLAFLVDDLDEFLDKLPDEIEISQGPMDMSEFVDGMRVCWFKDPEGNIIELNQGYKDEDSPPKMKE